MVKLAETIFSKLFAAKSQLKLFMKMIWRSHSKTSIPSPVHILVILKNPLLQLADAESKDHALMGHLLLTAKRLPQAGLNNGYRLVINTPDGGQTVYHLHLHILGGRQMT